MTEHFHRCNLPDCPTGFGRIDGLLVVPRGHLVQLALAASAFAVLLKMRTAVSLNEAPGPPVQVRSADTVDWVSHEGRSELQEAVDATRRLLGWHEP